MAYDCVNIPGAKKIGGTVIVNNFCGGHLITDATITGADKTVCCKFLDFVYKNIVCKVIGLAKKALESWNAKNSIPL